ncbi:MAG: S-methyl-5-thioribose-1-phosphate isomerase, partial [Bdellovibrionales bacterium]|nr:S-methyl-5-thioribose-1-phosphate isomerase [Bdellovibrionales bacterium]
VDGKNCQTIWLHPLHDTVVQIIDQRYLPHQFVIEDLISVDDFVRAIADMHVRGAPLIGVAAAFGIYIAACEAEREGRDVRSALQAASQKLQAARPTASNLAWALREMEVAADSSATNELKPLLRERAQQILTDEVERCRMIGMHGLEVFQKLQVAKGDRPLQVLTHCNAGWLACVDYGTATAPIYLAHDKGIPIHVWVDETRPRNQGALTAWELAQHGISHSVVVDNTGGHLMQHGLVDVVIVGTDRTTRTGDVANKIGTYLKALAAKDCGVPFYVALPSSSIDWELDDGLQEIPIEQRAAEEVTHVRGYRDGLFEEVQLYADGTRVANYAFDVTPARLVSGLITERGVCDASEAGLRTLFG